ncbi:MAG: 3'-5' exonuclease [bacterium]
MFLENYEEITDCIVIDTETVTDEITRISKVWEIGLLVIKDSQIIEKAEWLISPDAKFEKLDIWYPEDHISIEQIKASPKFIDLYIEFEKYLHPDFVICGHNIDYDIRMINQELVKIKKPLIGKQKVDTIRMARLVHPEWTHYKLDNLSAEYGLEIENRHRALDDAHATALAFLKMKEKIINKAEAENTGLF